MNIYITLDYELFLNDYTGDVDNCLIIPSYELLRVLDKHQIKATFFVDAAYIYRLNELRGRYQGLQEDYKKVVSHVKEIASQGQKIGLHLHPQWFYSDYDGDKWIIDFDHYKLSDMAELEASQCFRECKIMLEELVGSKIDSFRAGGYSIQTFKAFPRLMKELDIKSDSSVLSNAKNLSKLHYYDYSSLKTTDSYTFEDDVLLIENNGSLREYPISTSTFNYVTYCVSRLKMRKLKNNKNWGNGGDVSSHHRRSLVKNIFNKMFHPIVMSASIDYQGFAFFDMVYSEYLRKGKRDFVIIGHPKNFSPASLSMLDAFLYKVKNESSFKTI